MDYNQKQGNNIEWKPSVLVDDLTGLQTKAQLKLEATKILEQKTGKYAYVSCDVADVKYVN